MPPQQPNDSNQAGQYQSNVQPSKSTRRTKALLAVLAALLVLSAALWLFATNREETQDLDPTQDSGMVISVTNDGFAPDTVLIPIGTTVTWTNDSDNTVHIASNPHPEHDGLPGFDSQEPIFIGESYSFTFEQSGTYGYHDHLDPETNGTVEVEKTDE